MTLLEQIRRVYPETAKPPAGALWALIAAGEVPPDVLDAPWFREELFGAAENSMVGGDHRQMRVLASGEVVHSHPQLTTFCEAWLHDSCDASLLAFEALCECRCHEWNRGRGRRPRTTTEHVVATRPASEDERVRRRLAALDAWNRGFEERT